MGLMSDELYQAIRQGKPVYPVLEMDIGGVTKRYASARNPIRAPTLGMYDGKILSWSATTRGGSPSGNSLQSLNATVEIEDSSGDIDAIATGEFARSIAGSAVRGKRVSPAVDASAYFTFYVGVIKDYRRGRNKVYSFDISTRDEALKGRIKTPPLSKWDFPNAEDKDRDIPTPLVFGEHDSSTVGGPVGGMVPCIRIGNVDSVLTYLVMHGLGDGVTEGFVNGVSDGSIANNTLLINGRHYHTIDSFGSPPAVGDTVTVDIDGITDIDARQISL